MKQKIKITYRLLFLLFLFCFLILPKTTFLIKGKAFSKTTKKTEGKQHHNIHKKYLLNDSILSKNINPWNFTITITSKRIMLKKDVRSTKLTIKKKGKKSPIYKASFTSLSSNGKKITYTILPKFQKKLCPANSTKDGTYEVTSPLFSKRKKIRYKERITSKEIAGYVMDAKGNPLSNAKITLQKQKKKIQTKSNRFGYYHINAIAGSSLLTVSKKGYQTNNISNIVPLSKGTLCKNFILSSSHSSRNTNHTLEFIITDSQKNPAADISISITQKGSTNVLFCGKTDKKGTILFSNTAHFEKNSCTVTQKNSYMQVILQNNFNPNSQNRHFFSQNLLSANKEYTIHIEKNPLFSTEPFYQKKQFSFIPSDFPTNTIQFRMELEKCKSISFEKLSIQPDSSVNINQKDTLSLQLFHPSNHMPFYKKEYNIATSSLSSILFSIKNETPALPDGYYYIQLFLYDTEGNTKALSPITKINVIKGNAYASTIFLHRSLQAKALHFCEYSPHSLQTTYYLYQKTDGCYYYQGTFVSPHFIPSNSNYMTTNLTITPLCINAEYILLPQKNTAFASKWYSFTTNSQNTSLTGITSSTNAIQIHCLDASTNAYYQSIPEDFSASPLLFDNQNDLQLSSDWIQTSLLSSLSVIATYKFDGTFDSAVLTNHSGISLTLPKGKKPLITDIYTNNCKLKTNQHSYH